MTKLPFASLVWILAVFIAEARNPISFSKIAFAFDPAHGSAAVPVEVQEMKSFVQQKQFDSFDLAPVYRNDALILQRSVEFLYPSRLAKDAPVMFVPLGTAIIGCLEIGSFSRTIAYDCR